MGCVPHPAASNSPAAAEPVRLGHCCPFELYTANTSEGGYTAQELQI